MVGKKIGNKWFIWLAILMSSCAIWFAYGNYEGFSTIVGLMMIGWYLLAMYVYVEIGDWKDVPFKRISEVVRWVSTPAVVLLTVSMIWYEVSSVKGLDYGVPAEDLSQSELFVRLLDLKGLVAHGNAGKQPSPYRLDLLNIVKKSEQTLDVER